MSQRSHNRSKKPVGETEVISLLDSPGGSEQSSADDGEYSEAVRQSQDIPSIPSSLQSPLHEMEDLRTPEERRCRPSLSSMAATLPSELIRAASVSSKRTTTKNSDAHDDDDDDDDEDYDDENYAPMDIEMEDVNNSPSSNESDCVQHLKDDSNYEYGDDGDDDDIDDDDDEEDNDDEDNEEEEIECVGVKFATPQPISNFEQPRRHRDDDEHGDERPPKQRRTDPYVPSFMDNALAQQQVREEPSEYSQLAMMSEDEQIAMAIAASQEGAAASIPSSLPQACARSSPDTEQAAAVGTAVVSQTPAGFMGGGIDRSIDCDADSAADAKLPPNPRRSHQNPTPASSNEDSVSSRRTSRASRTNPFPNAPRPRSSRRHHNASTRAERQMQRLGHRDNERKATERDMQHAIAASNRMVRDEQDAEYYNSLRQDREKEEQKKAAKQREEEEAQIQQILAQSAKEEAARRREKALESLPQEPAAGTSGITTIALKLPRFCKKPRVQRRFPASLDTAEGIYSWVETLEELQGKSWQLVLPVGHKVVHRSDNLKDVGLSPRGLVVVEVNDDEDDDNKA